jgi:flagellar basal body-associated protein FliL
MLKNKKILAVVPILLFLGYTMTKPKPKVPKTKIQGTIYVMPKEFLLNLKDGRYAKVAVALDLAPGQSDGVSATSGASGSGEAAVGTLPEEPVVREIITDTITNQSGETLVSAAGRKSIRAKILTAIRQQTDVKLESVLFPDLTVQ